MLAPLAGGCDRNVLGSPVVPLVWANITGSSAVGVLLAVHNPVYVSLDIVVVTIGTCSDNRRWFW
jgi:hypothetical protein